MKADWRPCSVAQPWFSNEYFVTYDFQGRRCVGIAKWSAAKEEWTMPDHFLGEICTVTVIAWDEIPSAYRDDEVPPVMPIVLDDKVVDPHADTVRLFNTEPGVSDR